MKLSDGVVLAAAMACVISAPRCGDRECSSRYRPEIEGEWWPVAGDPDLGEYTRPEQQPVDFAVWQAADGSWQLWSCIRHTGCGGHTRLFHGWRGDSLSAPDWQPQGIVMQADTALGEQAGGLQAPFVIKIDEVYYMFYDDWGRICLARSLDGVNFERLLNERGQPDLFSGPFSNSRDPMVIEINGLYHCYYTGHLDRDSEQRFKCAVFCRTSADLRQWSDPVMVSAGGRAATMSNWWGGDCECPFVVYFNGCYYLFRNQLYGEDNLNTQYASPDPKDFGVDHDRRGIGTLAVAAPEIIHHRGRDYIAVLKPSLKGIRIARLKWTEIEQKKE